MKKFLLHKIAATALACALLLQLGGISALAQNTNESTVTYKGSTDKIVFTPNSNLFDNMKNMVPGDSKIQIINLKNESSRSVDFYLRAEAVADETPKIYQMTNELAEKLGLKLVYKRSGHSDTVLYDGRLNGLPENPNPPANTMSKNIYLGRYYSSSTGKIEATLTVPAELDNDFKNAAARFNWIFTCEEVYSDDDDDDDNFWDVDENKLGNLPKTGGAID